MAIPLSARAESDLFCSLQSHPLCSSLQGDITGTVMFLPHPAALATATTPVSTGNCHLRQKNPYESQFFTFPLTYTFLSAVFQVSGWMQIVSFSSVLLVVCTTPHSFCPPTHKNQRNYFYKIMFLHCHK